ncbi:hypothetical protein [Cohnella massiliensis]|uniref:hypothetical protein n=1 Tax=Cohnella massiliensis TaxID=1816691 RepID=UPI003183F741
MKKASYAWRGNSGRSIGTEADPPLSEKKAKSFIGRELKHLKSNRELLLLSLPGVLYKLIFAYLPMVGLVIAFKNYRYDLGIFGSEWAGLDNFKYLFSTDTAWAWRITRNTVLYNAAYMPPSRVPILEFIQSKKRKTGMPRSTVDFIQRATWTKSTEASPALRQKSDSQSRLDHRGGDKLI